MYHVLNRANARLPLFESEADYELFVAGQKRFLTPLTPSDPSDPYTAPVRGNREFPRAAGARFLLDKSRAGGSSGHSP